jgi:glutamyl-tRNA synthetase
VIAGGLICFNVLTCLLSGRLQTVALKATPAPEAPKAKAAAPAAAGEDKVYLSNASSGFAIPIKTTMFESDRIYGNEEVKAEAKVNMFPSTPIYDL